MPLLKLTNGQVTTAVETAHEEVAFDAWRDDASGAKAIVIPNDVNLISGDYDFGDVEVIILEFPQFKDGRAYSQARLLRERHGFKGEIRARGDVLRDQLLFMARCGFDGFEINNSDVHSGNEALGEFSFAYQPAADAVAPVWRRRLDHAKAA